MQEKGIQADIVCCMQNLQLCFESEEHAKKLLNNVSSLLKPGGYFFGIIPDSSTIWTKYQKNVEASHNKGLKVVPNSIRSDNYTITFEIEEEKYELNFCIYVRLNRFAILRLRHYIQMVQVSLLRKEVPTQICK
uniref:mRNA (guanine-N(7))-methyltransferase n=2 Tax=Aegilops tauschii subsp. strangulata TaxID=200361 RepID=A0A453CGQ4_AEGTS